MLMKNMMFKLTNFVFFQILELQKQLENQFAERGALESAMFSKPASDGFACEYSISKVCSCSKLELYS